MGTGPPIFVENGRLCKSHGGSAVHQAAFAAQPATRRLHERGLHLDSHHTHIVLHAARGSCHGDIEQRHQSAAMRHRKGIEMLRLGRVSNFRQATLEQLQLESEEIDKGNGNAKPQAEVRFSHRSPRSHHRPQPATGP